MHKIFFSNFLARDNGQFLATLDEALFSLQNTNLVRKAYYAANCENNALKLVLPHKGNFFKKLMVVGAISCGTFLPLITVPQNVKISSKYYVDYLPKPLLEIHLAKLHGKKINEVIIHERAATSDIANLTQDYAKDLEARPGIKIILNS